MKFTSAEANKYLRKLNDDYLSICKKEDLSKEFLVTLGENVEAIRPEYDFFTTFSELNEIERKIVDLKSMLSSFERKVFVMYLQGKDIEQIAQRFKKSNKTIYNALATIRDKLKENI